MKNLDQALICLLVLAIFVAIVEFGMWIAAHRHLLEEDLRGLKAHNQRHFAGVKGFEPESHGDPE